MATSVVYDFSDFRGGFHDAAYPSNLMNDNELYTALNCRWQSGLTKRGGRATYATITGAVIQGGIRWKIGNIWRTILAVEATGGAVQFKIGTATAFSTITRASATGLTFTASASVQFAGLGEHVVAVNGTDKPVLFYPTISSVFTETLERYDTRVRDDDNWFAGQLASANGIYVNDSGDAQSSASIDFSLASGTAGGAWVSSDFTFNKFVFLDTQANASATFTFQYFGRADATSPATWVSFTPIDVPTWSVAGNKTVEFDVPFDPNTHDVLLSRLPESGSPLESLTLRYAARMRSDHASNTAISAQGVRVEHTQYLGQLLLNDRPSTVAEHKGHLFLGMGNWMRYSPLISPEPVEGVQFTIRGWKADAVQFFQDGGNINQFATQLNYLAIMLETRAYALYGNSWDTFELRPLFAKGTIARRGAVVVDEQLFFVARDGIWGWDGNRLMKLSRHVENLFETLTLSDAAAADRDGEVWLSFPSNGEVLIFDPDTFRLNDLGEGKVSLFRFNGYRVDQFLYHSGDGDNGFFIGLDNTAVQLNRLENGTADAVGATTAIDMRLQSRYLDPGQGFLRERIFRYIKPLVADVSQTSMGTYTVKFLTRSRHEDASSSALITASLSSGVHSETLGINPRQNGANLGFFLQHNSLCSAKFFGFSVAVEEREY